MASSPPLRWSCCPLALLVLATLTASAAADDTRSEFWPEFYGWVRVSEGARLLFLASGASARDDSYAEGSFGVHLDVRLQHRALPMLSRAIEKMGYERSSRYSARIGYRYGVSLDGGGDYEEQRVQGDVTGRWGLPGKLVFADRNRAEFRWLHGEYSFRYRNRIRFERDAKLAGLELVPYGSAEIYYDTRYDEFNRARFIVGVEIPMTSNTMVEPYLSRQNDRKSSPRHVNALGLTLSVSF